jgi:cysteine desulfurase
MSLYFDSQYGARLSPLQERAVREAYLTLYTFAGAKKEDHFIFTSSGAEGVNHAVFAAYLDITRKTGKNHFLCSSLDEAPAIMALSRLQQLGCVFQMIPASSDGLITKKAFAEMITPRTAMLSISWANALSGVIQPLSEVADLCKERGILLHVDATHVLGKGDFTFDASQADLLTFYPPYGGVGGMFIGASIEISPLILGGKEQGQMRGGPFHVPALLEFAKWAKEERSHVDHYCIEIARLRALFEELLCSKIARAKPLFQHQERVPHITSLLFPGVASDALHFALVQKGVYTTFGGNHLQHIVHILKACKITPPDCHSALSFAFSHHTTEEEIKKGAAIVVETVGQLQKYSEYLTKETP